MSPTDCFDESMISGYLDGELPTEAAAEIEKHLSVCQKCEASYQSLRYVDEILTQEILRLQAPELMKSKLESRIGRFNSQAAPSHFDGWKRFWQACVAPAGARIWAPGTVLLAVVTLIISLHFKGERENQKLLAEIEQFKVEMVDQASARNPFDIDGKTFKINTENPFQGYFQEHGRR